MRRGYAVTLFEYFVEIRKRAYPAFHRYFQNAFFRISEPVRGVVEPFKIEIVGKGHARSVFKNAADMFVRVKERFENVIKPRNKTFGVVETI